MDIKIKQFPYAGEWCLLVKFNEEELRLEHLGGVENTLEQLLRPIETTKRVVLDFNDVAKISSMILASIIRTLTEKFNPEFFLYVRKVDGANSIVRLATHDFFQLPANGFLKRIKEVAAA